MQPQLRLGRVLRASALLLAIHLADSVLAVDVYTEPVGFYKLVCLTNSDTRVSIPFTRPAVYQGLVAGTSGSTVSISNSPNWTAGEFVYNPAGGQSNTFYLLVVSTNSNREGAYFTITNNTSDTVSVELNPENLGDLQAGHQVQIIPYWTLNTIFPNGSGVTPSPAIGSKRTLVLFPDIEGTGINLAAKKTFYFSSATLNWREFASGTTNFNNQIVLPDQYFIVRQNNAPTTTNVTMGVVPMGRARVPLYTLTNSPQDSFIAVYRPAAQTLNESGLASAFVASPLIGAKKDLLLVFNNNATNVNKSAAKTYYYSAAGMWREFSSGTTDVGTNLVFVPGTGAIVRKAATNAANTVIWVNQPNYTNQ